MFNNFNISKSVPLSIAVLISGNGSNLQALIDFLDNNDDLPAKISLVISNNKDAYGLIRAQNANIPTKIIPNLANRKEYGQLLNEAMEENEIDFICLAGFMRILDEDFVNLWKNCIINIHPSLLPSFKGANAIEDAMNYGVKYTGCTVHFVIPEIDSGAIIDQEIVKIEQDDNLKSLTQKIHEAEHKAYPRALSVAINYILSSAK